jgi:predicted RNA methylase
MDLHRVKSILENSKLITRGSWADIGAGTGIFTLIIMELLEQGKVYAVDKSPHALWSLKPSPGVELEIIEADFNDPMDLPEELDGIIMANALHFAENHLEVIKNVTSYLQTDGAFILVEYETDNPRPPWVPFPLKFNTFKSLCIRAGMNEPVLLGSMESAYGYEYIYVARLQK